MKKYKYAVIKYVGLFVVLLLNLSSCKKSTTTVDQASLDAQTISTYLTNNKITATQLNSTGIYYTIATQGIGDFPNVNSNVTVQYRGYLTDGATVFAQSPTTGNTFNMALTIAGLQQTLPLFRKGGKGTVFIPSAYGYGIQATGLIPANSVLVFDIQLLDVKN